MAPDLPPDWGWWNELEARCPICSAIVPVHDAEHHGNHHVETIQRDIELAQQINQQAKLIEQLVRHTHIHHQERA